MRQITTTLYTIDELTPKARERAVQYWIDNNDMPDLYDAMREELDQLLREAKMTCDNLKLYYRLNYSQGDGAMFTGNVYWGAYQIEIKHNSPHYYHEKTAQFWGATSVKTGRDMPEAKFKQFVALYEDICQKVARYGYDYIEYENDPDNVIEILRANECEFYEDGGFYYE